MTLFINSVISIALVSYVVFELVVHLKKIDGTREKLAVTGVSVLHFSAALAFVLLLDKLPNNDAEKYYNAAAESANWLHLFSVGGFFISFLIYPLVKLKLSIEVLFLLFATISFKGYLEFLKLLNLKFLNTNYFFLIGIVLIPSLHFWTGFLGKEALLFLLMVLLLKKVKFKHFDWGFMVILGLIFLIRPHVFFMLLIAFVVAFLLEKGISKSLKIRIAALSLVSLLVLVPIFATYFLKIDLLNFEALQDFYLGLAKHSEINGNSKIDLLNTTLFTRIGYLLFMPLPFLYEIENLFQWMASFENVYYIGVLIFGCYFVVKEHVKFKNLTIDQRFAFISSLLLIVMFGAYLYNLGLGNRMRVMFLPYLFYTLITMVNLKLQNEKETN